MKWGRGDSKKIVCTVGVMLTSADKFPEVGVKWRRGDSKQIVYTVVGGTV